MAREKAILSDYQMAWLFIGFLWVSYFLCCCDRQVVYVIFPVLRTELGMTSAQLGLTGSLFIWTTGITSPFSGKLSEKYSKQSLVVWTLALWSTVTFLTGFSNSPGAMLTGRAFLGITEAVFVPVAVSLIGTILPPEFHARATGLFFSAQLCGIVMGGWLGGWFAEHLGWRFAFFGFGIAGTLFAIPMALFFRRAMRGRRSNTERQNSLRSDFVTLGRIPTFVCLCACFPVFLVVLTILYAWLPTLLHDKFSLGLAEAGFKATAFLASGTALGLLCGSYLSDRLYRSRREARFWLLAASMILGAPWLCLVSYGSLTLAELGAAGFGLANGIFTANIMVAPFDVIPSRTRTTAIAVINTIVPPFSGIATFLTGVWKERIGISTILMVLVVLMIIAGIGLFLCISRVFAKDHERILTANAVAQAEFVG